MAGIKISDLPSGTNPLTGAEVFPIVQAGGTVKIPLSAIGIAPATSGTTFDDPTVFFAPYTPSPNARFLYVHMCGGGGGGGGGAYGNHPGVLKAFGGGGGGGGYRKEFWIPLNPRPSEILVNVGAGGGGGIGGTASFPAATGADGGASEIIINYANLDQVTILAPGGTLGYDGGTTAAANGAPSVSADPWFNTLPAANSGNVDPEYNKLGGGGGQGAANLFTGVYQAGYAYGAYHPPGGGGGGSVDFTTVPPCLSGNGGESRSLVGTVYGGVGANPAGIVGQNGINATYSSWQYTFNTYPSWLPMPGVGGGGGGATAAVYSAGNGGNGYRGAGGGGGGGFLSAANPLGTGGNGGNGGNGYVTFYEFF